MQQGGSSYGVTPEVSTQFVGGAAAGGGRGHMMGVSGGGHDMPSAGSHHLHSDQKSGDALAEAASPISSRPPARSTNFDELVTGAGSGLPDDDALAGEEAERGSSGNRWPRQETLALLKIRSDMDAAFRDATLKGPLWEEVSRKLAELGHNRNAKKCKEKFENVHKYYKRTKEGRAGRQDGKSYRFFTQLEALQGNPSGASVTSVTNTAAPPPVTAPAQAAANTIHNTQIVGSTSGAIVTTTRMPHTQPSSTTLIPSIPSTQPSNSGVLRPQTLPRIPPPDLSGGITLSSGGSSTSGESSDEIQEQAPRKRKRSSSESSTRKMMNFFEELMKQVVEKQVALQQRFLETIEKREEDRMIREEAWKRQEMARLSRELDILAHERAMSASRDAAVISFLQKITGQTIDIPPPPQQPPLAAQPIPATPQPATTPIQPQPQQQHHHHHSLETRPLPTPPTDIVTQDQEPATMMFDPASSRWPKPEVLSLIKLRNGLQSRYEEAGPKGPLWEEISAEMAKMGYKRSAKRCKEKWENINKYYKKVKESNKKRPEDSKTCPYFQELDALYRKKGHSSKPDLEAPHEAGAGGDMMAIMPTPISAAPPETARPDNEGGDGENGRGGNGGSGTQVQKGNGAGFYSSVVDEGNGVGSKKPEDIVKELMEQRQRHQVVMDEYTKINGADSENGEPEDDDDEDHEEDEDKVEDDDGETRRGMTGSYQTQYSAGSTAGSFITMVQ